MKKTLPKDFEKLASSPTKEGILKSITKFYGGCSKILEPVENTDDRYHIRYPDGNALRVGAPLVIETTRGFYFGFFNT